MVDLTREHVSQDDELVLHNGVLISHEVLEGGDEASPVFTVVVVFLSWVDQELNWVQRVTHQKSALSVEVGSVNVLVNSGLTHNLFIGLGDNSDQEVQKNNQDEQLVEEPH